MSYHDDVSIYYDKKVDPKSAHTKYRFKVYTEINEYQALSGHRFVNLISPKDGSRNPLSFILQSIKRAPYEENKWAKAGKFLEPLVLDLVKKNFTMEDVETHSFEDTETSIDPNFAYIRDFSAKVHGIPFIGEIKTYYKREKLGKTSDGKPVCDIDWLLQLRLEIDCAKEENVFGAVFYYYVDPSILKMIDKDDKVGLEALIKKGLDIKELNMSDTLFKYGEYEKEDFIQTYFSHLYGISSFTELKDIALERRNRLLTRYVNDHGKHFYYCDTEFHWSMGFNTIESLIAQASKTMQVQEVENIMEV